MTELDLKCDGLRVTDSDSFRDWGLARACVENKKCQKQKMSKTKTSVKCSVTRFSSVEFESSYRVAPVRLRYAREVIRRVGGYWMGRVSS